MRLHSLRNQTTHLLFDNAVLTDGCADAVLEQDTGHVVVEFNGMCVDVPCLHLRVQYQQCSRGQHIGIRHKIPSEAVIEWGRKTDRDR